MATFFNESSMKADEQQTETRGLFGKNTVGDQCCCPLIVVYLIETECLNINNAGCPDWQFCQPGIVTRGEEE